METLNLIAPPEWPANQGPAQRAAERTEPGLDIWGKLCQLCASTAVFLF